MSTADDRYNHSRLGHARWNRYARRVRLAEVMSRRPQLSYFGLGLPATQLPRIERIRAMATQTTSPFEAAIAQRMLDEWTEGGPSE